MPNNARRVRRNILFSTVFVLPFAVAGAASAQSAGAAGSGSVAELVVTATQRHAGATDNKT
jgi:hypothetical protein